MSNAPRVNTVLICKNSMLREGIKHILSSTRFNLQSEESVYWDADAGRVTGTAPDLLIIDANLYPAGIDNAIRSLKEQRLGERVVVLADHFDLDSMLSSFRAGATGYCLTTIGCEVLIKYLDLVMLGEVVFPTAFVLSALSSPDRTSEAPKRLVTEARQPLQAIQPADIKGSPVRSLSSREAEILQCLVQGAPNKVIARKLDVAEATVKVHIKAILRKIRVANRTQAAMWAVNHLPVSYSDHASLQASERLPLHYSSS